MKKISEKAKIGKNVKIGDFTIIHDNVIIEDDTIIESHCDIGRHSANAKGKPLHIGANSHIRSQSVLYEGSSFEYRLNTGHGVMIRENVQAGRYLQVGTNSILEGETTIGHYTKIHSAVQVGQESIIGNLVWIFPQVQFTNDKLPPSGICDGIEIGDLAVVSARSLLMPGVKLGMGSFIGADTTVSEDIEECMCLIKGLKRPMRAKSLYNLSQQNIEYPWPKNFRDGYPQESFQLMDEIVSKIELSMQIEIR